MSFMAICFGLAVVEGFIELRAMDFYSGLPTGGGQRVDRTLSAFFGRPLSLAGQARPGKRLMCRLVPVRSETNLHIQRHSQFRGGSHLRNHHGFQLLALSWHQFEDEFVVNLKDHAG